MTLDAAVQAHWQSSVCLCHPAEEGFSASAACCMPCSGLASCLRCHAYARSCLHLLTKLHRTLPSITAQSISVFQAASCWNTLARQNMLHHCKSCLRDRRRAGSKELCQGLLCFVISSFPGPGLQQRASFTLTLT